MTLSSKPNRRKVKLAPYYDRRPQNVSNDSHFKNLLVKLTQENTVGVIGLLKISQFF